MRDTRKRLFEMMNRVAKMPLDEIDWEGDFSDVSKTCINTEELKEYLNDRIANRELKPYQRKSAPLDMPHIHLSALSFDEAGELNVEQFITDITKFPNEILGKNEKIKKSETESTVGFNIGIPALRGLVYDIDNKEFYVVNTCPGAGTCKVICYAKRGNYIQYPVSFVNRTRILNLLLNEPEKFEKILEHEIEIKILKNEDKQVGIRWNDSGDFFTNKFFEIASRITANLLKKGYDLKSYAYTKMGDVVNMGDPNMIINFSDDASRRETEKVDTETVKSSKIVPQNIFDDLLLKNERGRFEVDEKGKTIFKDSNGLDILKNRISNRFGVSEDSLLSYDEMMKTPEGEKNQYNVIIMPKGDGDVSAQREDVKTTFLLFH